VTARIASIVVAGFVVLGALMPSRGLHVVLRPPPLMVTVEDGTGLVTFVGPGPADETILGAVAVPGHPNAVVIGWLGGQCDDAVRIGLGRYNDQIHLYRSTSERSGPCLIGGIERSIILELREPIDPARIIDTTDWLYSAGLTRLD
jgi:hypothetical protein